VLQTSCPCSTSDAAIARPIPELAPVTRMFFMRTGAVPKVRFALSVFVFAMDMVPPPLNAEDCEENRSAGDLSDNST
jgi:hypothetical protein